MINHPNPQPLTPEQQAEQVRQFDAMFGGMAKANAQQQYEKLKQVILSPLPVPLESFKPLA